MAFTFKHGDRPLEDYTIQRAVGSGGFGEVYYAMSDGGREVALKYLRDNPQIELRGVSHCMNLKSPHLISIFDVKKSAAGEYFIIMEYCSGPSLRDLLIAEPNGFGPQKAAFFVREIAKGLSYLHDRGIVHRDLKPGNLFYDDGYVKIGDYGLSKFISVSRHSAQTASIGTVHYMAPEIGSGNYSRGVDIYALGVMLYEMLLGRVPFEGSSMGEVLMKHLTAQPAVDELPNPFANVIRRALRKDPNERYAHVNDMVSELLDVEEVQQSLAGFSVKSLEGAVRRGTPEDYVSPNSPQRGVRDRATPYAEETLPVLPDRLAKKVKKISKKIDRQLAKLGRRSPGSAPSDVTPPNEEYDAAGRLKARVEVHASDQATTPKRMILAGIAVLGLCVTSGVIFGNFWNDEVGVSAGMLPAALAGGILLSRKALRWFGESAIPNWSVRVIRLGCTAPLVFAGMAPMLDRYSENALPVALALLGLALFGKWEKESDAGDFGEMRFGHAFGVAVKTGVFALIVAAIMNADTRFAPVAGAIGGVASLCLQAAFWALSAGSPTKTTGRGAIAGPRRVEHEAREQADHRDSTVWRVPPPPYAAVGPTEASPNSLGQGSRESEQTAIAAPEVQRRLRWGLARMVWVLVSFGSFAVMSIGFVIPFVFDSLSQAQTSASILTSIAGFCLLAFSSSKTGTYRRDGFWRETLRPAMICASLFGIGATILLLVMGDSWGARERVNVVGSRPFFSYETRVIGSADTEDDVKSEFDASDAPLTPTPPGVPDGIWRPERLVAVQADDALHSAHRVLDNAQKRLDDTEDAIRSKVFRMAAKMDKHLTKSQWKDEVHFGIGDPQTRSRRVSGAAIVGLVFCSLALVMAVSVRGRRRGPVRFIQPGSSHPAGSTQPQVAVPNKP